MFQGDKHNAMPQAVYDSRWHGQLIGWVASLTLKNEARHELSLPWVVCEYEDVFPNELPGLLGLSLSYSFSELYLYL